MESEATAMIILHRSGLRSLKNIEKFLLIPSYQDQVAEINTEIVEGITKEMRQLTSLYLGVTKEWLEAMAMTSEIKVVYDDIIGVGFLVKLIILWDTILRYKDIVRVQ